MTRKKIVAGNWKMNTTVSDGVLLAKTLAENYNQQEPKMIIIPPFTHLFPVVAALNGSALGVGAQNCHQEEKGAFTGEISAKMLSSIQVPYVVLGHSERRQFFGEQDILLAAKIDAALSAGLIPIFCVGESLDIRNEGKQNEFVRLQLQNGLFHLSTDQFAKIVIAYEPIWAIGTGVTASPEQAQDMHQFIRKQINQAYGEAIADEFTILYGGSVKGSNAKEIFAKPDVDGALVGGASLDAMDFLKIARSF